MHFLFLSLFILLFIIHYLFCSKTGLSRLGELGFVGWISWALRVMRDRLSEPSEMGFVGQCGTGLVGQIQNWVW